MKKLFIGALIALSTVSFIACGNTSRTTDNAPEPTQVEEQASVDDEAADETEIPVDDEVSTIDDSTFSADLLTRTDQCSAYCFEIQDICNQLANDPYSAPSVAYVFDEYVVKFMAIEYTEDEMAMMSDEQLDIALTLNSALDYLETGCGLLSDGCETMDAETIELANYYIELANDVLTE